MDDGRAQWYLTRGMASSPLRTLAALLLLIEPSCTFYTGPPPGGGSGVASPGGSGLTPGGGGELDGGKEPKGAWADVTSNLAGKTSGCPNISLISANPAQDMLIAGVANRALWASTDGGQSWSGLGLGALSVAVNNVASTILYDPQNPDVFWESGINGPGGVFLTGDSGKHFVRRGVMNLSESLSIDFSDPDRNTMLVGGHSQKQTVFRSTDNGATWDDIGKKFPSDADASTFPLVLDASTYLMGCPPQVSGKSGIYLSTDAGDTWQRVSEAGGGSAPLLASDGSIYWATPNFGGLVVSTDQGQSFSQVVGPNLLKSVTPIELPNGNLAAMSANHIVVSADLGKTWHFVTAALPYAADGFTYSPVQKAFFAWRTNCIETAVPKASIGRFEYDDVADPAN